LLRWLAWPRERYGDDWRASSAGDSLSETAGNPSRNELAYSDVAFEPPSAGKNGDRKKDERCIGEWSSRPDRSQQGPGSERRRSEDRNADWQHNGSLGSTHRLRQQLEDSRQSNTLFTAIAACGPSTG